MKPKQIELQYTINLGNYSNVRIGGTWDVEENEDVTEAFIAAREELKKVYATINDKKAEEASIKEAQEAKLNNLLKAKENGNK